MVVALCTAASMDCPRRPTAAGVQDGDDVGHVILGAEELIDGAVLGDVGEGFLGGGPWGRRASSTKSDADEYQVRLVYQQ
jgi:hypothetical protein